MEVLTISAPGNFEVSYGTAYTLLAMIAVLAIGMAISYWRKK